jgi:hypothetical protein
MVIDKIDTRRPAVRKTKNDSPICSHCDGPKSLQLTLERMKPKTRATQPLNRLGSIERSQISRIRFDHFRRQVSAIVALVKAPQPLVPKAVDHSP